MTAKINGRWYCYQRPLRLMVEVPDPKVILSGIWRQVPQLGPKALLVPLMHFRYPSRRCWTCDQPHLNFVFQRRLFSYIFLSEERLAFRFGDLATCRSAPLPRKLCIVAALPDDLKLS
jgi:hypothetical protein